MLSPGFPKNILLADDDRDDGALFRDALDELNLSAGLKIVQNGEQLMQWLHNTAVALPDVLFLDVNMPRKNGFDCLSEIKQDVRLRHMSVIILSTSNAPLIIDQLYLAGAQYFIRKPNNFDAFKKVVHKSLLLTVASAGVSPSREQFVLS